MKKQQHLQWRRAWAALPIFLGILVLAGTSLAAPSSSALEGPAMAELIGGSGGPGCAFGAGLATGLGIAGSLATLGGVTSPIGAALGLAGALVGAVTYLTC